MESWCLRGNGQTISIHASTREATSNHGRGCSGIRISIHASTREATLPGKSVRASISDFNSRLYTRGDLTYAAKLLKRGISIHASTREATLPQCFMVHCRIFQFTPLHERRPSFQSFPRGSLLFQFTPLHERRHFFFSCAV